ncbi:MAG: PorT family protein [Treponema sp.]|jgi:hypothetical protein|nr:PorT family protein [Treponema sp.]
MSYNEKGRKEVFNGMMKHNFLTGLVCIFLFFPPCTGSAQTPSAGTGGGAPLTEVAVMAFAGDDTALSATLRDASIREIQNLGNYNPRPVPEELYPEILSFPPDEPPAPEYLGASKYVLTGEYYTNPGEELGHFQLWLWNSGDGSLVYTDELVAGNRNEALNYMPIVISWIFSRILEEEQGSPLNAAAGTPEAQDDPLNRWLYVGIRAGGSFRFYTLPELTKDYYFEVPYSFTYEASFQFAFRFLPFMSVQVEAVFTQDRAMFRGPEYYESDSESLHIFFTDSYTSLSLMFPVTVKFPLVFAPFIVSPFGGAYWTLPLGKMALDSSIATRTTGKFDYELTGRFGVTAGVDMGIRLGPGILFLDTRYGYDFGETVIRIDDQNLINYRRTMLSVSIGYELALLKKKQRTGGD